MEKKGEVWKKLKNRLRVLFARLNLCQLVKFQYISSFVQAKLLIFRIPWALSTQPADVTVVCPHCIAAHEVWFDLYSNLVFCKNKKNSLEIMPVQKRVGTLDKLITFDRFRTL